MEDAMDLDISHFPLDTRRKEVYVETIAMMQATRERL